MTWRRQSWCRIRQLVSNSLVDLQAATDHRGTLRETLPRIAAAGASIPEEVSNTLHEEADARFSSAAEAASNELFNWLLLQDEGHEYDENDYEYILKIGTSLQNIAANLVAVGSSKAGISDEVAANLKQETSNLLKEVYHHNC